MAAPKGNEFWKARSKHGRDKIFSTPEILKSACEEYFQWVEDNPNMVAEVIKYEGKGKLFQVPKKRIMTIGALCLFLDVNLDTWGEYRKKEGFSDICTQVEQTIYYQKLNGAASDQFNAAIIARDLGLKDRVETEHGGIGGGAIKQEWTVKIVRPDIKDA